MRFGFHCDIATSRLANQALGCEYRFVIPDSIVTMRHVAEAVGVATSTVSKALRHDPSIPEARCREICAAAEKLGYRPDPMVATLMARLHHRRRRSDPHNIAWIDLWGPERSRSVMNPAPMLNGARQRASELGYGIEVYRPGMDNMSPERLRNVLAARAQWGLIIPAVPESAMRFPFDLRGFAGVTIGTSLHEPVMHRVSPNHFQGCTLAFEQLRARGFKRIGLVLSPEVNERVEGKWLGAFSFRQHFLPAEERVAALVTAPEDRDALVGWLRTEAPDAILTAERLTRLPTRTPGGGRLKLPFICLLTGMNSGNEESGLDYRPGQLGAIAVEMVVAQIHRNERGSPSIPNTILIDAVWVNENKTVSRKRNQ